MQAATRRSAAASYRCCLKTTHATPMPVDQMPKRAQAGDPPAGAEPADPAGFVSTVLQDHAVEAAGSSAARRT